MQIDEESIRRYSQWPWPRDLLATVIAAARGASAIGVDVLMPDQDRLSPDYLIRQHNIEAPALRQALLTLPHSDEDLAVVLRSLPTVLAMAVDGNQTNEPRQPPAITPIRERGDYARAALPRAGEVSWPLPILASAAHAIGIVSAPLGPAGKIQMLPVATEVHGTLLPSFGAELLRIALNAGPIVLQAQYGTLSGVTIGGLDYHVDPSGGIRPRFLGPARLTTMQAYRLLDPAADRSILQGRIVVIGVTAPGVGQRFRTPLGTEESGAAIQAELIESMLAGDTLWRPIWAEPVERIAALVTGLAAGLLLGRIRYRTYAAALIGTLLLLIGGSVLAFRYQGILLDWVFPVCCLFVVGLAAMTNRIGVEVAERRRHEAELAMERQRRCAVEREVELRTEADTLRQSLAFAVDAAQLGVWDADLRGGTWHHCPRHDTILGLVAPPRWGPNVLLDRVLPEDRAAAARALSEGEASGSLQLECRIRLLDGTVRHVQFVGRFWKDSEGVPTRVAGVVVDVTRQRELELRLRHGEKMQAIGLLAGGVAHNFNNLLTVVLGNLELASNRLDPSSKTGSLLGNAMDGARRSADIARQLLAFARMQPLNPKPVDTAALLRSSFSLLRNAMPSVVRARLEIEPDLGTISIDPVDLELALLNLAMNARDAMPDGGNLVLHAFKQRVRHERLGLNGNYLVLEVTDDGEGIMPETLPNVFEPFFTTKPVGKGTGLGLSQVHGFANQSGGAVDIESEPGRGTSVRLYLPSTQQVVRPTESRSAKVSS